VPPSRPLSRDRRRVVPRLRHAVIVSVVSAWRVAQWTFDVAIVTQAGLRVCSFGPMPRMTPPFLSSPT